MSPQNYGRPQHETEVRPYEKDWNATLGFRRLQQPSRWVVDDFSLSIVTGFLAIGSFFWWQRVSRKPKRGKGIPREPSTKFQHILARKRDFLLRNSHVYGYRGAPGGYIDDWRPIELPYLLLPVEKQIVQREEPHEGTKEIYLDYAGAALPTKRQLDSIHQDSMMILANPHSNGPAASRALLAIQKAKQRVLQDLDALPGRFASLRRAPTFASPAQCHSGYDISFTSGTTEGLRMIAERFPWKGRCKYCQRQSILLYAQNSHTSVIGMRQVASREGAGFACKTLDEITHMTQKDFESLRDSKQNDCTHCKGEDYSCLLAIPAECNFGGTRPDAQTIVATAQRSGWYTLVDIAKAASTGPVSLRQMDADFAVLSFYKLFGAPTGLGALVVKQTSVDLLLQSKGQYHGGGSVNIMLPNLDVSIPRTTGLSSLNNGTSHFRGIASLEHGFHELERRGGMHRIHEHATCLARELTQRLEALRHGNTQPVVALSGAWADPTLRGSAGPTVVLNILRGDGSFVGYNEVSKLAALHCTPIQFRTGCFCNPGACQEALALGDKEVLANYTRTGHVCGDHIDLVDGKPTGAIRISFGKDSLWEDLDYLVSFVCRTFVNTVASASTRTLPTICQPRKVKVSELYVFPIKSCAGQRAPLWKLQLPSGKLLYDREFALVDTSGTAIRLQTCPKMTTITPKIDIDQATMTISAPGKEDLVVTLNDDGQYHDGDNTIKVCGNRCGGRLWGDHAVSEWFSSYLGVQCWLARFAVRKYRPLQNHVSEPTTGFANEQALLLISKDAVTTLNGVLKEQKQHPVGSRHFRPNLVVEGQECNALEDDWKSVTLARNGLELQTRGSCARCAMVDFDPYSGQKGKTLRALAKYRRRKGQITFGIFLQAVGSGSGCWIEEGDELLCR